MVVVAARRVWWLCRWWWWWWSLVLVVYHLYHHNRGVAVVLAEPRTHIRFAVVASESTETIVRVPPLDEGRAFFLKRQHYCCKFMLFYFFKVRAKIQISI